MITLLGSFNVCFVGTVPVVITHVYVLDVVLSMFVSLDNGTEIKELNYEVKGNFQCLFLCFKQYK